MLKCQQFLIIMILVKIIVQVIKIHFKMILIIFNGLKKLEKIKRNIWVLLEKLKMLKVLVFVFHKIHKMNF
jgi:hypothetical protein